MTKFPDPHDPIDSTWTILEVIKNRNSISFTAKLLGYSQSQISRKIQNLEHHLGVPLLIRNSRGVNLTPSALKYLDTIQLLRETWRRSSESIHGITQITLGCHPLLAREYLGIAFPKLLREFPELDLKLKLLRSPEVVRQIASSEIHFGIIAGKIDGFDLIQKKIAEDSVRVYSSEKNVKNIETVFYNPEMIEHQKVIRLFKKVKLIEIHDYELIAEMSAQKGMGGILPASCAARYRLFPGSEPLMITPIFWLGHPNLKHSEQLKRFFRIAGEQFSIHA